MASNPSRTTKSTNWEKLRSLSTRIKSVRQDFCQSVLEIQEASIVERLEMKLDEMLQSMVTHMEICNSGTVPLSVPEANLVKLCQSVSDSPVCHSTSVRSLFSCKVEGLNFITGHVVTAFDVQLAIPIADTYTLKLITVMPLFTKNTKTIKIMPEQSKPDQAKSNSVKNDADPMAILAEAILAAQNKVRRGKRDVVMNQIHSVSNKIYAAIESAQDKYTFGFQTESDCKRLSNTLLICDWLHATKLDNCWYSILNDNEEIALQTCKSTTSMTVKSCFVKQLQTGYVVSTSQSLDINVLDSNTRQNEVLKETESSVCNQFCTLTLGNSRKSLTCDGKRLETSILSDVDIIVKPIASKDIQIDLSHLRPEDYSDTSGFEMIDNFIKQNQLIAPTDMQRHLKVINLITTIGSFILLVALCLYMTRRLCRWPWFCRVRWHQFPRIDSMSHYNEESESDPDRRRYKTSKTYPTSRKS